MKQLKLEIICWNSVCDLLFTSKERGLISDSPVRPAMEECDNMEDKARNAEKKLEDLQDKIQTWFNTNDVKCLPS